MFSWLILEVATVLADYNISVRDVFGLSTLLPALVFFLAVTRYVLSTHLLV